jgi:hypothetical protein
MTLRLTIKNDEDEQSQSARSILVSASDSPHFTEIKPGKVHDFHIYSGRSLNIAEKPE